MSMKKTVLKKQQTVEKVVAACKGATSVYLFNYQGIPVSKDSELRNQLNAKGVKYFAVKNTLLKRVLEQLGVKGLDDQLFGWEKQSGCLHITYLRARSLLMTRLKDRQCLSVEMYILLI